MVQGHKNRVNLASFPGLPHAPQVGVGGMRVAQKHTLTIAQTLFLYTDFAQNPHPGLVPAIAIPEKSIQFNSVHSSHSSGARL